MLRDVSQRIRIARTQSRRSRQFGRWLLHVSDFGHQHFARQREVDGPGWIARGDLQRAGDDFAHLLRPAQLVVPLHEVANDAVLVELFLQPVNVGVASAALTGVGRVRSAPGSDQDRRTSSLRVMQHPAEVLRADVHVHQHGLWPAGRLVIAVRRRQRDELEQTEHRAWNWFAELFEFRERFLDRNRVGARVHEQALDAVRDQRTHVGFGRFSRSRLEQMAKPCRGRVVILLPWRVRLWPDTTSRRET